MATLKETFENTVFEGDYTIESVSVSKQDGHLNITLLDDISETAAQAIEKEIASVYGFSSVCIVRENKYENFKKEQEKKIEVSTAPKSKIIYDISQKGKLITTDQITSDGGAVSVRGEIFGATENDGWSGKKRINFDLSDETGSISCKLFLPEDISKKVFSRIKSGIISNVKGEAQYDKYTSDPIINVTYIEELPAKEIRKDDADVKRVELHLHTKMSSMDGLASVTDLIARAHYWGHKAVAITDHGIVQAFPDAHAFITKKKYTDLKIIYGVEAYLTNDFVDEASYKKQSNYHITILAKNQTGLMNLYKIISESHLKGFYKRPRVWRNVLQKYREGLILGSACERGEVMDAIVSGQDATEIAKNYDYLEIMPLGNNQFMIDKNIVSGEEDLKDLNNKVIKIGEKLDIPVVATGDVHFLEPEDHIYRAIVQSGIGYGLESDKQAPLYFRTTDEMLAEFEYLGKEKAYEVVVTNTNKIADMTDKIQPVPDGVFTPEMDNAEEELIQICKETAKQLYGDPLPEIVKERMDKELSGITKYGFSVLYLIAQRLVAKSLADGYLVGSRGSVGSSFVAFLSGITEVNSLAPHFRCSECKNSEFITDGSIGCGFDLPDKKCPVCDTVMHKDGHDIPFETFLGFEGDKEPDIDLNFSGDYQPVAHKYVEELFGEGYVFRAGTLGTLADKTAFGFVKGYLTDRGKTVHSAEINRLVRGCRGVKRTTGQHPGGLVILPKGHDIHEFTPIQYPAGDGSKNIITTHFEYDSIKGRLLKLDILGHDDPTVIKMLETLTGINARQIPLDDKKTMSLFLSTEALGVTPEQISSQVGTFGIPEFGTRFVRQMLLETKPTTFGELVRISGLSHGTDVWSNNAQDLVKDGITTLKEVICTRDDIMVYLMYNSLPPKKAFDIMERVRKNDKQLTAEDEALMREHNIPDWYIQSCHKIQYMFPKAHAAAYVTMAFRIAWFKVNYPKAFYIAYFSVRADEFDAGIMLDEKKVVAEISRLEAIENTLNQKDKNVLTILQIVREMFARGEKLLPIDIYKSDAKRFLDEPDGIRPPLSSLPGLGKNAAEMIAVAREEEDFQSIEDLRIRGKVNKTVIEAMREQGILGDLPESSQLSFF